MPAVNNVGKNAMKTISKPRYFNSNANDRLSGHHVIHFLVEDKIISKSVNQWIKDDPILLYQSIHGKSKGCILLPSMIPIKPSLQMVVYKVLVEKIKDLRPDLIQIAENNKKKWRAAGIITKNMNQDKK